MDKLLQIMFEVNNFCQKKKFKIDVFDFMVYFVMFRCFICVYVKYYLLGVVVMLNLIFIVWGLCKQLDMGNRKSQLDN